MIRHLVILSLLAAPAFVGAPVNAQMPSAVPVQTITGTRLDVAATGEVSRVPDIATINAGVVTMAPTASAAIRQNAERMNAVRAGLRAAGIADRDIQTSNVSLNPQYRYRENEAPVLTGYQASNQVSIRFRDIERTGPILDALVAQGANQINGPMLGIDEPEAALDEARMEALRVAGQRAEAYARALGMQVVRTLSVSETGGMQPPPMPMFARAEAADASTSIDPGEQTLSVTLSVSFELR